MENAGRHVGEVALTLLEGVSGARVVVVAGPGNNGGDGLVAARHLANAGVRVGVALSGAEFSGDAATNLGVVRAMGVAIAEGAAGLDSVAEDLGGVDLVIDALFGTGLTRAVEGEAAALVEGIGALRSAGACVLSVDLPSGLDADSGKVLGVAVHADVTVTLVGVKPGFGALDAQAYLGEVVVADIGAPAECVRAHGRPPPPLAPGERVGDGPRTARGRSPRSGGRRG